MIPAGALLSICCRYAGDDYYVGDLIPPDKLQHFRREMPSFALPAGDAVIALLDCTVFGSNKEGVALCTNGLYWNQAGSVPQKGFLAWEDLLQAAIRAAGSHDIDLRPPVRINLAGCGFGRDNLAFLLSEVQIHVMRAQPGEAALPHAQTAPSLPVGNETHWTLAIGGRQFGPYDAETVRSLIEAHRLDPGEGLAWRPGLSQWLPIAQVPELGGYVTGSSDRPAAFLGVPDDSLAVQTGAATGSIDLNNAPLDTLLLLPGITLDMAARLVEERKGRAGFTTLEEVGEVLRLQPHQVERLRGRTTLLPYNPLRPVLINLNRASEAEIASLPGIGPIWAKKAMQLRQEQGGFHSLDGFCTVLKLPPHIAERLRRLATVEPVQPTPSPGQTGRVVDY